jgi:hypothetical protein
MSDPRLFRRSSFLFASAALGVSACSEHNGASALMPGLSAKRPGRAAARPDSTIKIKINYSKHSSILYVNNQAIFQNTLKDGILTVKYYTGKIKKFTYPPSLQAPVRGRGRRDFLRSAGISFDRQTGRWYADDQIEMFRTNGTGPKLFRVKRDSLGCPQDVGGDPSTCPGTYVGPPPTVTPGPGPSTIWRGTITPPPRTVIQTIKTISLSGNNGPGGVPSPAPLKRFDQCFDWALGAANIAALFKNAGAIQEAIATWIFDTLPLELVPGVDAIYTQVIAALEMIGAMVTIGMTVDSLYHFADDMHSCLTGKSD